MSQEVGDAPSAKAGGGISDSCRKLILASVICFVFMIFEIGAGIYSGSLAIVTDAAHMLSDLCSFGISLVAIYLARKPPTSALTFGYQRAEMLGALLSIMLIWALTLWLVVKAITRIWRPTPVLANIMIITGVFGLISNIVLALVLSDSHDHHGHHHHGHHHHGHHHEHVHDSESQDENNCLRSAQDIQTVGHDGNTEQVPCVSPTNQQGPPPGDQLVNSGSSSLSELSSTPLIPGNAMEGYKRAGEVLKRLGQHSGVAPCASDLDNIASAYIEIQDETIPAESHGRNVNIWAAYLHTLGDMVQNVGVIIAGVIIHFRPTWTIADPICTIFFAVIVVYTTLGLIQEALMLLMEASPQNISAERVARALKQIPNVTDLHDLHIWSLAPGTPALACHLVIGKDIGSEIVLEQATKLVQEKFGVLHTTIQVDFARNKAACETNAHGSCRKNN